MDLRGRDFRGLKCKFVPRRRASLYVGRDVTGRNRLLGETGSLEKRAPGRNRLLGETGYWEKQATGRNRLLGETARLLDFLEGQELGPPNGSQIRVPCHRPTAHMTLGEIPETRSSLVPDSSYTKYHGRWLTLGGCMVERPPISLNATNLQEKARTGDRK